MRVRPVVSAALTVAATVLALACPVAAGTPAGAPGTVVLSAAPTDSAWGG
jgi:hypothetical protein